jgi:hypothetical protein
MVMNNLYYLILASMLLANCTVFEIGANNTPEAAINTPSPEPSITPTVDVCYEEFKFLIENAPPIIEEWKNEFALTMETSKQLLPGRIENMRRIKQEMEAVLPVRCPHVDPENHYGDIALSMDEIIKGYMAYLADEPQSVINEHFQKAIDLFGGE